MRNSTRASLLCRSVPNGRKSMFNGLADSIWVGSKHQDEAWKWVKFLGF